MARYFNGREVELLAPVGTFEIFKQVIGEGCDAVYLGGPSLNMRLMRKGYNFTLEEMEEAIRIAHSLGKKVYVTVNNMLNEQEMEETAEYLKYLETIGPDALIVQDFAVVSLIHKLGLKLHVHSSVMMNAHNIEMVLALKELGVTRVVTSREMDLHTTRQLLNATGMELEYFIHGDLCSVHGANCYFSSAVFGNSSNRGRCLKPCRWEYRVKKDGNVYPTEYPLAAKDMFMYEHIPELIQGGITSFKIEGRMRDAEFVQLLVRSYSDAIDRYLDDPVGFDRSVDTPSLFEHRKRDFTTAYSFGRPGLDFINRRYEGTGKFYSTGKVFSTPTAERELEEERIGRIRSRLAEEKRSSAGRGEVSVHVNNMEQAKAALAAGADHIYLSGDVFEPDRPFTKAEIKELGALKGSAKLYLGLPRMMREIHFEQYDALLRGERLPIDGILITNIGAIRRFASAGYPMIGDYNLNILNHLAGGFYREQGLERYTVSMEAPLEELAQLLKAGRGPVEAIVHGSPALMYMEHDLYENAELFQPLAEEDNVYVPNDVLVLMTDKGENPVYRDAHGRCHLMMAKELCLLPAVKELLEAGLTHFRIEGAAYRDVNRLAEVVAVYRRVLDQPESAAAEFEALKPVYGGYTAGALHFNGAAREAEAKAEVLA
ncbi:peptidase U32 family protein [Paenibacillus pinistramenti]|uniref:peptidase U32 family protein n=1 Tax=Paenibacillus pinistramenti TaxID=1768003 RepID=UPI001108AB92|nr:U32 family peptidase [Paenibacillus pinistramenti]